MQTHLKQLRISELFAQVKKEWEKQENLSIIRTANSIEWLLISWHKEEISQKVMEQEENQFMEWNLLMKTSITNILSLDNSLWLTLAQELMEVSSLLPLEPSLISMECTLFSEKLSTKME